MEKEDDVALKAMKVNISTASQSEEIGGKETPQGYGSPSSDTDVRLLSTEQISFQILEQPILLRETAQVKDGFHVIAKSAYAYCTDAAWKIGRTKFILQENEVQTLRLSQDSFSFKTTLQDLKDSAISQQTSKDGTILQMNECIMINH